MAEHERLKRVRKNLGYTQGQMAELMGYSSKQAISRIERGESSMSPQALRLLTYIEKFGDVRE